jgi:hypothetical protein
MFGRKSRAAVLERELSEVGSKAADTIGEIAESALAAAREATRHATPVLEKSAESLSKALERAADSLSDAGEKLAKQGEHRAADAAVAARQRIADASERLAQQVRPKARKRHRVRRLLIAAAVVGGIVALVQSPLRNKISERLFGPPPEEEPESIELPGAEPEADEVSQPQSAEQFGSPATATGQSEGNGVASAPSGIESGQG